MTLELERIEVDYGSRRAVKPTSLTLCAGEFVGLVGPNGAGKSSLLKATAGVIDAAGSVSWSGARLPRLHPQERARMVAYLPQAAAAYWPIKARNVVALGRLPHRRYNEGPTTNDQSIVDWALDECDATHLAERSITQLSGGEQARVLLARALAVQAPVLLVDEPIQSLDPYHQLGIMQLLHRYVTPETLVVTVLHDLALAARYCSRIVLVNEGSVVADGRPEVVLTRETLGRYYRVAPYLAEHDGESVVLPWRKLGDA